MARYVLIVFLFRLLLPFLITLSICFRPCGLCGIYVLLRFYLPFVPVPTSENMKGHAGIFLKILLGISILTFTSQVVFQITLAAFPAVSEFLEPGSIEEKIFQHVGFVPLKSISISDGFIWMSPEVIMLFSSIFVYAVIKKLTNTPSNELGNVESGSMARATKVKQNIGRLVTFGRYVVLVLLCTAGVLRPSIFSGVYYLVFLSAATWWACYKQLNRTFAVVLYCLAPIVIVHLAALYTYQLPWPQELVDRENPYLRYFGITALFLWNTTTANVTIANVTTANVTTANVTTNSTVDPRHYTWNNDEEWVSFIHTECIFVLFYFMILEAKELFNPEYQQRQGTFARLESSFTGKLGRQMSQRLSKQKLMRSNTPKSRWQKAGRKVQDLNFEELNNSQQPGETTPLLRGVSPASKRSSAKKQDSTASGTFTGEDIPLDELDEEEYELTIFDNILYGLETVLQLIVRSSYIGTNIIMMAWSITYLSWITFVLLIWANLIWLVPKQRKSMLATSPFLVLYAWFLLVSGLIYSMRLTEEELPSRLNNVDLAEIGFVKVTSFPCGPLFVKSLFTVMFWVTLRQFMQERMEAKQTSALADMVAPLQVTVGTATVSGASKEQEHIGSKVMGKVGNYLKTILTKYWILVVAITLFAVAITGQRMTGFRILYMALFLLFVITFQLSFRAWRKMMFGFWLTIIIYSMMILIATYTYQFKEFPKYWTEYLHVSKQIQADMGLEQFETKQLFVRLVTPTFFVIITVIQLHYFHKDFMELSDPKNTSPPPQPPEVNQFVEDLEQSSMQGGAEVDQSAKSDMPSTSVHFDIYALQGMSKEKFYDFVGNISNYFENFKNILYLFLELHMIKFVLFFAMLICIFDMCAIYIIIIVLISLAFTFGRPMQIFAVYSISILVSIMILARMIFQVQYIKPEKWSVTCNVTVRDDTNSTIKNNAPWLGFQKEAEAGQSLPGLVKWNIMYILAVTVYSVVIARQYNYRLKRGLPTTRAFFMFPDITRKDADKNISNCIQYLCNFGFYKFGFEMTAMMIVALIDLRLDIYAFFHAVFLFGFCFMSRATIAKVWIFYLIFIAISLPFQYFMVIGILPTLCYEFPWDGNNFMWEAVQDWAFLLDNFHPLDCRKLICDFLLLVFVSRQWVVFRIEKRYVGKRYAGGSNESVIHYIEEKDFKNPVHDYVTYVWSYLCIVKKLILQSFLWVTLAMVFLCGTNRVNIYSLGYLIFVFFFLWHGSDLYLRPIPKILRWWQWLIGYTAGVILLKTIFQMVGCVFCTLIETKFCWAVQMLSVMCVRKFKYSGAVIDYNFPELDHCGIEAELVGVAWDVTCLVFLLLQRRVFNSYYFFHIIDDAKADTILASRGAELLEERRHKTMKEQSEQEKKILEKIKIKMDRIKRNQQKIQDSIYKNRPKYMIKPPAHYKQAIRSGDYYMFDELEDEDIDLLPEEKEDEEEKKERLLKPGMGKLLSTAIKEDVDTAIRNQGLKRQLSMPVPKQPKPPRSQLSGYSAPPTIDEARSVRIAELPEEDEPQPGTSKDEDDSDLEESKESIGTKIVRVFLFLWAFFESAMVSLTNLLNKYSRNYRYVLKVLAREKRILKERTNYKQGLRNGGTTQVWQPAASYHSLLKQSAKSSKATPIEDSEYGEEISSHDQPTFFRLILAIWYIIMSRSEFLCYFFIFLNQIKTSTFLTLPLPLMIFFWGALTIPRPSKTFWITIIAYTEVIVLLKCIFQFDVMPGNTSRNALQFSDVGTDINALNPTRIFGLHRERNYAFWDLLVLLVVFFHRILLKSMGIWSSTTPTPAALLDDGEYILENDRLVPVPQESPSRKGKKKKFDGSQKSTSTTDETLVIKSRAAVPVDFLIRGIKMTVSKYAESLMVFNQQLLDPTSRVAADVYFLMFFCDFFNFFVLLFGYSSFGSQQDGGVQAYLEDNRVPPLFLCMLLLQFMLIIIDRGIYLRKNILAKIIFQYAQIILLHIWLFVIFPVITGTYCYKVLPPQIYYMVKCFYLLLSAYQIRCGYPSRILGNFLCKGYGYVNMWLFRGFMIVPFLFELRTCMDWMWTETSMTIFDWIKMEDIFQHIYLLKCTRTIEDEYPQPRGEKKKPMAKYLMGGAVLAVIIAIIWFPLVFFSLGNTVGEPNIPVEVHIEIRLSTYEPLYKMTAQSNSIYPFTGKELTTVNTAYNGHKNSETFLYNYEAADIAAVKLSTDSANIWSISPPDRKKMLREVNSSKPLTITLKYDIIHKTIEAEDSADISKDLSIILQPSTNVSRNPVRDSLFKMLKGENATALLEYIFPKFLKVTNKGEATPVSDLMLGRPDVAAKTYRNMTISLQKISEGNQIKEWWTVKEQCNEYDFNYHDFLKKFPHVDCRNSLVIYTFNDRIFPQFLNFLTGGGIIGLYTTLVLLASRLLRGFFADQLSKIMFDDLPFVDRVLQLCLDVYLVREASEFSLEEDLFAKLVFLFRSPETLIKWTRPKEEVGDEDDDEDDDGDHPEAIRE